MQRERAETRLKKLRVAANLIPASRAALIAEECGVPCLTTKWWEGQCKNHKLPHHSVGKGRWLDMNVVLDVIEGVIRKTAGSDASRVDIDRVIHHGALLVQRMRQRAASPKDIAA